MNGYIAVDSLPRYGLQNMAKILWSHTEDTPWELAKEFKNSLFRDLFQHRVKYFCGLRSMRAAQIQRTTLPQRSDVHVDKWPSLPSVSVPFVEQPRLLSQCIWTYVVSALNWPRTHHGAANMVIFGRWSERFPVRVGRIWGQVDKETEEIYLRDCWWWSEADSSLSWEFVGHQTPTGSISSQRPSLYLEWTLISVLKTRWHCT